MAFSNTYILGFAASVCVVCSVAVAGAATGLREMQELNRLWDHQETILAALVLIEDGEELEGPKITERYEERVRVQIIDRRGESLPDVTLEDAQQERRRARQEGEDPQKLVVYQRLDEDGQVTAHGLPLRGPGMWGPIGGFLSVAEDGESVLGARFTHEKETPGLGARIAEDDFQERWAEKRVLEDGEIRTIEVRQGGCAEDLDFCVDGLSGATITVRGVNEMIEDALAIYDPYLRRVREGAES